MRKTLNTFLIAASVSAMLTLSLSACKTLTVASVAASAAQNLSTATPSQVTTLAEAEQALRAFELKWDRQFPSISKSWRVHWPELITFMKYPAEIRKAIYTTTPSIHHSPLRFPLLDCLRSRHPVNTLREKHAADSA